MVKKEARKKKKQEMLKRKQEAEEEDDDFYGSDEDETSSVESFGALVNKWDDTFVDVLQHLVETSKSKSSGQQRAKSLRDLAKLCQRVYTDECIGSLEKNAGDLVVPCIASLKSGDKDVIMAANSAIRALCWVASEQMASDKVKDALVGALYGVIDETGEGDENDHPSRPEEEELSDDEDEEERIVILRNDCLSTLGIYLFIAEDQDNIQGFADEIKDNYFEDDDVSKTAVQIYTLLLTCTSPEERSETFQSCYRDILNLFENPTQDLELFSELGFLSCLFLESYRECEDDWLSTFELEKLEGIIEEVSQMYSKSYTKKDLAKHKRRYREFAGFILEEESPSRLITVNGHEVAFDTWVDIIRFEAIKTCVQSGITHHIMVNDTVRQVLAVEGNYQIRLKNDLTKLEKKYYFSKNSGDAKQDTLDKNKRTRFIM